MASERSTAYGIPREHASLISYSGTHEVLSIDLPSSPQLKFGYELKGGRLVVAQLEITESQSSETVGLVNQLDSTTPTQSGDLPAGCESAAVLPARP